MLPSKPVFRPQGKGAEGLISLFWYGVQTATAKAIESALPTSLELGGTWNCLAPSKKVTVALGHT